ncbi:MAG: hypothetical protein IJ405_04105 [Lachnospiraceae bacterium]|nr:hypothetical protein [Lachnospiraceae bacterium]
MEALMTLDCSNYSESIVDVLKIFQQIGWYIYNPQGKVEYLPIGDDDEYDWQCKEIAEIELYDIISEKIAKKEQIGINLFYSNGTEGISLMAYNTSQIMLSITINRKTVKGKYTNMAWYLENIIYKFLNIDVRLLSYKIEEYED